MQTPKLLLHLPEYISTPDSMEIDKEGNLILSCPNFANETSSGCVVKIDKSLKVTKWFDVPINPETGVARNMGIALNYLDNGCCDVYLCDNQGWSGDENLIFKGRIIKVTMNEDNIIDWKTVAYGMEHPNGVRIYNGQIYVTQSCLSKVKDPSGLLVSCVYKFELDDENIAITNTLSDPNIITKFITFNPDCQYGADGLAFDKQGNLYVGNFGDGAIYKIIFNADGTVKEQGVWAQNQTQLQSTDGIIFDKEGNLYVADFSANAIAKITPDATVIRLAQSGDCSGFEGGLEQPGEPIIWDNKIVASCFDLVTGPDKINTGHEMPSTLSYLDMPITL